VGVVVVDPPGTVVVVDAAGIETDGAVTVVVVDPARAAGACSDVRTEQIATTAAAGPSIRPTTRTRERDAGRERPHRDRREFMSAPECDRT
jgi:hypothetical protein